MTEHVGATQRLDMPPARKQMHISTREVHDTSSRNKIIFNVGKRRGIDVNCLKLSALPVHLSGKFLGDNFWAQHLVMYSVLGTSAEN